MQSNLLPDDFLTQRKNAALYCLVGDVHDRNKDYAKAHSYYQKSAEIKSKAIQQTTLASNDVKVNPSSSYKALIKREQSTRSIVNSEKLVFIFGFPRSGTTLTDNILDTQKNTLVFSEAGVFRVLLAAYNSLFEHTKKNLAKLTHENLEFLRKLYFSLNTFFT